VVIPRLESAPHDDIDADAQEFLKVLEQADVIKKGGTRLKVNEQVEIAVWTSLSPSDRAEHRDPMSPAPARDAENLSAATAQFFQDQYLAGHSARVSPRTVLRSVPAACYLVSRLT
jgi:hypothetical protein